MYLIIINISAAKLYLTEIAITNNYNYKRICISKFSKRLGVELWTIDKISKHCKRMYAAQSLWDVCASSDGQSTFQKLKNNTCVQCKCLNRLASGSGWLTRESLSFNHTRKSEKNCRRMCIPKFLKRLRVELSPINTSDPEPYLMRRNANNVEACAIRASVFSIFWYTFPSKTNILKTTLFFICFFGPPRIFLPRYGASKFFSKHPLGPCWPPLCSPWPPLGLPKTPSWSPLDPFWGHLP